MHIKPCPFCGQNGALFTIQQDGTLKYGIECNNGLCSCLPTTWFCDTEIEAVELWNNRKG